MLRIGLTMMEHPDRVPAALPSMFEREAGIDSIGTSEGYKDAVWRWLNNRPAWNIQADYTGDPRGGRDAAVLSRKGYRVLGRQSLRISEPVQPIKYGPQRYLHALVYSHPTHPDGVAHVNIHPNATAWRKPRTAIRREYDESLATTRRVLESYLDDGYAAVLSGDTNWPSWAPGGPLRSHLKALGMRWWCKEFGWIAWHPDYLRIARRRTIPTSVTKGDHIWMTADFAAAPKHS